jgi:hypothetical protein
MKTLILIIITLLLAVPCFAGSGSVAITLSGTAGGGVATAHCDDSTHDGAGNSVSLCEDFDGATECYTGYTSNCRSASSSDPFNLPAGNTIDFDATALSNEGTYSMRLTAAASGDAMQIGWAISATDTVGSFYKARFTSIGDAGTDRALAIMMSGVGAPLCVFYLDTNGYWSVEDTGVHTNSAATGPSTATDYYIWLEYSKGTGANSHCHVYVSTTSTKPAVTATIENGNASTQAAYFVFLAQESTDYTTDHLRVNTSSFGNDPQ